MSTFKEGQKVRVTDIAKPSKFRGEIFTLDRLTARPNYAWEVEEARCWFLEDELELVEEEPKFEVGDLVDVRIDALWWKNPPYDVEGVVDNQFSGQPLYAIVDDGGTVWNLPERQLIPWESAEQEEAPLQIEDVRVDMEVVILSGPEAGKTGKVISVSESREDVVIAFDNGYVYHTSVDNTRPSPLIDHMVREEEQEEEVDFDFGRFDKDYGKDPFDKVVEEQGIPRSERDIPTTDEYLEEDSNPKSLSEWLEIGRNVIPKVGSREGEVGEIVNINERGIKVLFANAGACASTECYAVQNLKPQRRVNSDSQPTPEGKGRAVTPLVIEDLRQRDEKGQAEYGESLRAQNGRNAAQDAYEEVLDLAQYLKQVLLEREQMHSDVLDILDANNTPPQVVEQVNQKLHEYGF